MKTQDYLKGSGSKSNNSLIWDFFRFAIPFSLFCIGTFLSTQLFAEMMNYDTRVVGNPTTIFGKEIYSVFVYFAACIKYSMNSVASEYIIDSLYPMFIFTGSGILFVFVWGIVRMIHSTQKNVHGTARFANEKDLKENGLLAKEDGVIMAQLGSAKVNANKKNNTALTMKLKKQAQFIQHSGKANSLLLAPTGSGKGVGFLIPTLLNYKGSMIVFDPKGENYNITAGYRKSFSRVIRFAPCDNFTARFNPLMAIRDGDEYAFRDANLIADIIFAPAKAGSSGTEEHFNNLAKGMATTAILHVRFSDNVEDKSLAGVLKFLTHTDYATLKEKKNKEAQGEESGQGDEQFMSMLECKHYYVIDGKKIESKELHSKIAGGASRVLNIAARERSSVFTTVFSKMQLFDDPLLAQATSGDDFEIEDFINCEEPITLYLTVPYSDVQRIAPVFKLLISFMLKKFSGGETQHGSVKLKNHLLFMLDEFPTLGYFPDIAEVMGVLRGYGINFIIVCQALSQLVDRYGQNHPFLDHCTVQVVYAPGSTKDAEEFSAAIGNETFTELKITSSGK